MEATAEAMAARRANWRLEMGTTGFSVIGASFLPKVSRVRFPLDSRMRLLNQGLSVN
jgi:hypothetical protein